MKIWSVSNQKGGVGKTTTVVTLGGLLASWGYDVLLVDLDPHGSLTSYFQLNPDTVERSVYNLFLDAGAKKKLDAAPYIVKTDFKGLSLLPASTAIATLDRKTALIEGMGLVVANSLGSVKTRFDYVLIDSPPMLGVLMINALAACECLIVPVLTEFLALKGLERMLHTLEMVHHSRKSPINYVIVPTQFDRRTSASVNSLEELRERYPDHVWDGVIPVDTKIRDASAEGIPAPQYHPGSRAVMAYANLLETLTREEDQHAAAMG